MILILLPVFLAGQGIIVSSGIYLKMSGGALVLSSNWLNNGSYADTNSLIIFNGNSTQYIGGTGSTEFDDMTINNSSGIRATGNFTVDGVLNLSSANASAFLGTLDMGASTLTMDSSATTIGPGDVTGIVRRTTFVTNKTYSFGNQYSTFNFMNVGTLPTEISVKITIGSAPSWKTDAILRTFDVIQSGASASTAFINAHYLDTELNGNTENKMVFWIGDNPFTYAVEFGRSDFNTTNNWVGFVGDVSLFPSSFGQTLETLGNSQLTSLTWNGSVSTGWQNENNWTPLGVPSDLTDVIIPDSLTTPDDPILNISGITIGRLTIESGGILNSLPNATFKISGNSGAWINNGGLFNPNTSNVIFTNYNPTIAGATSFYNVTIPDTVVLWMTSGSIMRIAGAVSDSGAWRTVIGGPTIVDYNGGNQTVVVPNPATNRYSTLILSGSGTKIMPVIPMGVVGDFSMAGTATTTAGAALTTAGNFTLGTGTTFTTGIFNHSIGGNFTNNGIFNATGSTITCNGTSPQTLGGTSATTFDQLTIDNAAGVTLTSDALTTVSNSLLVNTGKKFNVAPGRELTASGTLTNNGGTTGFVLQSDTTGTASLLHNTDNVPATAERYISGAAEDWHFLSSPVAAQEISGSWLPAGTYGNGTGYDLYIWNEPNNCWIYKNNTTTAINWNTVHPGNNFTPGRGYLYSVQAANPTKAFAGNLINGHLAYALTTASPDASLKGFNLIGNPYPSSIDWQASSGWVRSNLVGSGGGYDMWIWNPAANNYGVCNSTSGSGTNGVTRYISPMQGYFVHAAGDGNIEMDNAVRVHSDASWFKSTTADPRMLSVVIQSGADKSFDEVRLLFGYNTNHSGARKLFSTVVTAPSLFIPSGDDYYSVRYLTDTIENPIMPVMFKPGRDGNYKITCDFDVSKFEVVMLEDRQMHYLRDMKADNTYSFDAAKTDDANRFVLHFGPDNNASYDELPARIYTDGSQLIIDLSLVGPDTEVFVYDVLGRRLLQETLPGLMQHKRTIYAKSQFLIVYLKNHQGTMCRKLFYNN
jgi:hypothetical protein